MVLEGTAPLSRDAIVSSASNFCPGIPPLLDLAWFWNDVGSGVEGLLRQLALHSRDPVFPIQQDQGQLQGSQNWRYFHYPVLYRSPRIGVSHRGCRIGSFFSGSNFEDRSQLGHCCCGSANVLSFLEGCLVLEGTSLPLWGSNFFPGLSLFFGSVLVLE